MMRSVVRTAIVSGAVLLSIAPLESAITAAPIESASRAIREVTIPAGTVLRSRQPWHARLSSTVEPSCLLAAGRPGT